MSSRIDTRNIGDLVAPDEIDQVDRDGRFDTPLGPNKLALKRFSGSEGLSELFDFHVDAVSKDASIDFDKLLGKNCCVTINSFNGARRYFNGVLTGAQVTTPEDRFFGYRLTLRPWLWLLGRKSNSRIFKQKNAITIIKEVFQDSGFQDFTDRVQASDLKDIEYCVQYRETDLNFVCRLMEEWGIYYFFEHSEDKHQLVLINQRSAHKTVSPGAPPPDTGERGDRQRGGSSAPSRTSASATGQGVGGGFAFIERGHRSGQEREHIHEWTPERRFRAGQMTLNDFDYMKPAANLKVDKETSESYARSKLEAYDHPGRYTDADLGKRLADIRLQAEQTIDRRIHAAGIAISLYPGALFDLSGHKTDDGRYLVVRVTHRFAGQSYVSGGRTSGEPYECHYLVLKSDRQFRAPLTTPRPVVRGPQTAIVTDESDDKSKWIDVDKEGRILVQFHWNRNEKGKLTSRRVRVAQMWSGKDWGWQVIPRVGQEVVVDFLEGDPDQPLVVGTVYNANYKYPYPLPENMTISGVKTECEEGTPGYNELIFEDKKKEENIRIHAQRFHEITVREKETRTIGVANKDSEVARQTSIEHGHDGLTLKHGDQVTLLKLGDQNTKLELGDQNVDVAKNINIKANMGITLTCGQSKIEITPASIKISSVLVTLEAQAMAEVKGSAMVTVKGGIVMIN